jgi:hypothetical protein
MFSKNFRFSPQILDVLNFLSKKASLSILNEKNNSVFNFFALYFVNTLEWIAIISLKKYSLEIPDLGLLQL